MIVGEGLGQRREVFGSVLALRSWCVLDIVGVSGRRPCGFLCPLLTPFPTALMSSVVTHRLAPLEFLLLLHSPDTAQGLCPRSQPCFGIKVCFGICLPVSNLFHCHVPMPGLKLICSMEWMARVKWVVASPTTFLGRDVSKCTWLGLQWCPLGMSADSLEPEVEPGMGSMPDG